MAKAPPIHVREVLPEGESLQAAAKGAGNA
jgi:hypothetical protein